MTKDNKNNSSYCLILAIFFVVSSIGCQTAKTKYVAPGGSESIISINQINTQDWINAADQMVQSLIVSGVIERAERQPAVLGISRIINDTQQRVDTDALVKKIRVALNKTGKVVTTTTLGLGGRSEDPMAKSAAEMNRFMNDEPQALDLPDFSLSGKLLEQRATDGKDRQVTYTFQLSLTELSSGYAIWEDEVNIQKVGRKSNLSW